MPQPKKHWNTCCRKVWSCIYIITWLFILLGAILYHSALAKAIPGLQDLPTNLVKGFEEVLRFNYLETDAKMIKDASVSALQKCQVMTTAACAALPTANPTTGLVQSPYNADTTAEYKDVMKGLDNVLIPINKVCKDKYFGVADLKSTGDQISTIVDEMGKLTPSDLDCRVTNEVYCSIFTAADAIIAGKAEVDKVIKEFTDNDMVKQYEKYSKFLYVMHVVPYILAISALFFFWFWYYDGACCCCGGGTKTGCCMLLFHGIFWFIVFVFATVVTVAGLVVIIAADSIHLDDLNGNPNLREVLDHIEENFPRFWDTVFGELAPGLDELFQAAMCFEVFCIVIVVYGCCMCCCRPYKDKKAAEDGKKLAW
mmetsp:Transcript_11276/g.21317  ORF Transcript_11276/g.21317 Transcript_11276/m.21317 type:complete len:369 (+) Transcript_11276:82-1188(+)